MLFKNNKLMLTISNIIYSFLMVVLFAVIYIIVDGGSLQNFVEDIVPKIKDISLIGIYLIFSTTQITNMAINHLTLDVDEEKIYDEKTEYVKNSLDKIELDELGKPVIKKIKTLLKNKIQLLKDENAVINNDEFMRPKLVAEFVKQYNEEKFNEKQEIANNNAIRKLEAKIYKRKSRYNKEETEASLYELDNDKKRHSFKKYILTKRLAKINKVSKLEKKLNKFKLKEINAKVKRFKPITSKSFYSVSMQQTKDSGDPKTKVTFKRKTLAKAFSKAIIMNAFTSVGLTVALQNLFNYDFANKWYILVSLLTGFILAMLVKYLMTYLKGRPRYKEEVEEVLNNINVLAKQCLNYCKGKANEKETVINS